MAAFRSIHHSFLSGLGRSPLAVLNGLKVTVGAATMERKDFSKSGNKFSEGNMSTEALSDARSFLEALHDAEFRGRKDTDGAARYRLSVKLGIKENYLFRLQYRAEEMRDVAGEVYRRLRVAYEAMCERNEKAADALLAQRLQLRNGNAVDTGARATGEGMGSAQD